MEHGASTNTAARFFLDLTQEVIIMHRGYRTTMDVKPTEPEEFRQVAGSVVFKIDTCEDGACAIHAGFGTWHATEHTFKCNDARNWLLTALPEKLGDLKAMVRQSRHDLIEAVLSDLWQGFVKPYVSHTGDICACPPEEALFLRILHTAGGKEFWDHLRLHLIQDRARGVERTLAIERCKLHSASVFRTDLDSSCWRLLGQQWGLLPCRGTALHEDDLLKHGIHSEYYADATDSQCDFLSPPWELRSAKWYAKGSSVALDVAHETLPWTKYAALFDGNLAFNDLRLSFLQQVCGPQMSALEAQIQQGNLSKDALDALLGFLEIAGGCLRLGEGLGDAPVHFAESAWSALRQCMGSTDLSL